MSYGCHMDVIWMSYRCVTYGCDMDVIWMSYRCDIDVLRMDVIIDVTYGCDIGDNRCDKRLY